MAISSIGNLTYINQNAQIGANTQASIQHRADIANIANMQDFQNKLDHVQEVRKIEENEAINPDADSKNQNQQGDFSSKEHTQEEENEEQVLSAQHILDIRV